MRLSIPAMLTNVQLSYHRQPLSVEHSRGSDGFIFCQQHANRNVPMLNRSHARIWLYCLGVLIVLGIEASLAFALGAD